MREIGVVIVLFFSSLDLAVAEQNVPVARVPELNATHYCYYGTPSPYSQGSHIKMQDNNIYECGMSTLEAGSKKLVWNVIDKNKGKNEVVFTDDPKH